MADSMVFGESVLNDAVAIVLYKTIDRHSHATYWSADNWRASMRYGRASLCRDMGFGPRSHGARVDLLQVQPARLPARLRRHGDRTSRRCVVLHQGLFGRPKLVPIGGSRGRTHTRARAPHTHTHAHAAQHTINNASQARTHNYARPHACTQANTHGNTRTHAGG